MDSNMQSGVIARVAGVVRDKLNLWFPPLEPLPQVAPPGTPPRRFDYMVGENIQIQPHLDRFTQLRALADGYDLLRIVIETFKDHLVKVPWVIRPVRGAGGKRSPSASDPRIARFTALLSCPDGEQAWSAWLRALLEDALVIDAPAIEPILTRGGELVRLDLIDGATITPKIGYDGRLPKPPGTAYQQIVKGAPTVEFTADELIYYPRNRRTHKLYGYSPVEQILILANLALRRELWLLNFFTEGSIPDAYLGLPDAWTPDQIKQAQDAFDSYLAGNLRNRRKVIFGPAGELQLLKADAVGGDAVLDELIVRMVCFAFNVSPQALVQMMNRATAQTAKDQAAEEGLIPWMMYVQELMNFVLRKYGKVADLEFAWQDEKEEDPTTQANNIKTLTSIGVMTVNEGRDRLGLEPVEGGDVPLIYTAQGALPLTGVAPTPVACPELAEGPAGPVSEPNNDRTPESPVALQPAGGDAGATKPQNNLAQRRPSSRSAGIGAGSGAEENQAKKQIGSTEGASAVRRAAKVAPGEADPERSEGAAEPGVGGDRSAKSRRDDRRFEGGPHLPETRIPAKPWETNVGEKLSKSIDPPESYFMCPSDSQHEAEEEIASLIYAALAPVAERLASWYASAAADSKPDEIPTASELWAVPVTAAAAPIWNDLAEKIKAGLEVGFSDAMRRELQAVNTVARGSLGRDTRAQASGKDFQHHPRRDPRSGRRGIRHCSDSGTV